MVYDKDIVGDFVTLRSISIDDAEFSYALRNDSRFINVMGQPAVSLESQRNYIERQRTLPGDYYFVVYNNKGDRIGLIGAYNINGDTCETGREINIGAPYETMEAELLLNDFCLNVLHLKKSVGIVYKRNEKHFEMLRRKGGYEITEIIHNGIPSYKLVATFEELNMRMENVRIMLRKLARKMGGKQ